MPAQHNRTRAESDDLCEHFGWRGGKERARNSLWCPDIRQVFANAAAISF